MSTITRLEFKNGAKKKKINISKTGQNMKCSIEKNGANFVIMEHMEQI